MISWGCLANPIAPCTTVWAVCYPAPGAVSLSFVPGRRCPPPPHSPVPLGSRGQNGSPPHPPLVVFLSNPPGPPCPCLPCRLSLVFRVVFPLSSIFLFDLMTYPPVRLSLCLPVFCFLCLPCRLSLVFDFCLRLNDLSSSSSFPCLPCRLSLVDFRLRLNDLTSSSSFLLSSSVLFPLSSIFVFDLMT